MATPSKRRPTRPISNRNTGKDLARTPRSRAGRSGSATRELFMLGAQQQGERLISAAGTPAFHLAREASKANDIATLNALTEGAIHSSDPGAVPMVVQSATTSSTAGPGSTARRPTRRRRCSRRTSRCASSTRCRSPSATRRSAAAAATPSSSPPCRPTPASEADGTQREFAQARVKASYDAFSATQQALDDAANG